MSQYRVSISCAHRRRAPRAVLPGTSLSSFGARDRAIGTELCGLDAGRFCSH